MRSAGGLCQSHDRQIDEIAVIAPTTDQRRLVSKPRKPALGIGAPPSPLNSRAVCWAWMACVGALAGIVRDRAAGPVGAALVAVTRVDAGCPPRPCPPSAPHRQQQEGNVVAAEIHRQLHRCHAQDVAPVQFGPAADCVPRRCNIASVDRIEQRLCRLQVHGWSVGWCDPAGVLGGPRQRGRW